MGMIIIPTHHSQLVFKYDESLSLSSVKNFAFLLQTRKRHVNFIKQPIRVNLWLITNKSALKCNIHYNNSRSQLYTLKMFYYIQQKMTIHGHV